MMSTSSRFTNAVIASISSAVRFPTTLTLFFARLPIAGIGGVAVLDPLQAGTLIPDRTTSSAVRK
jgi:hypothetical protein